MEPNETPRIFSERYELNHLIARGGMAEVYRAHDRLLDRPVALKVLFPELSVDRSFVERFKREAQAAANLSHPNIVPVFDWGEDSGTYFIVMEFIDGRPLSSILKTQGKLTPARTAEIGAPVAAALGYAHKHGVIHRDVKPGNVLITDDGQVKVTDFGIARAINTEESLTQTGAVMGTATYFSPEQAEGMGIDARSDLYSLGVVLYEMVTGRPPFLGDTPVAVASKHVRDVAIPPRQLDPSIPPSFEAIILKCLAKDPANRYDTAEDLRADLIRFSEGRTVVASSDTTALLAAAGEDTRMVGAVPRMDETQAVAMGAGFGAMGVMGATGMMTPDAAPPAEPRGNRTRTYAIVLGVLVVLLAIAGFLLARNLGYLGGAPSFSLPSVVGQTQAQATSTLTADGLNVKIVQETSTQKPGTVLASTPVAGTLVKKGNTVTLNVSAEAPTQQVQVPQGLVNATVTQATSLLQGVGLSASVVYKSSTQPKDTVLSTNPSSGTKVAQGSAVILTVSSGPANVTVPSLIGQSQIQAGQVLGQSGLNVGGVSTQSSTQYAAGLIISTSPPAGTSVAPGSSVSIVVSSGPPAPTTTTTTAPAPTTTTTTTAPGSTTTAG